MWVLQQCRDGQNLDVFLLHPVRLKMPTRTVLSTRKTETADGSGEDSAGRKDYTGPMLIAPGDYKWLLTGIVTYSGLGFAYLLVDIVKKKQPPKNGVTFANPTNT